MRHYSWRALHRWSDWTSRNGLRLDKHIRNFKGSIEVGEPAEAAAMRELAEESGLTGVAKTVFLGDCVYLDIGQHWFFYQCCFDRKLPESWEFFTEDDGGHYFRFHWRPIGDKIDNPSGPVFDAAREFVLSVSH